MLTSYDDLILCGNDETKASEFSFLLSIPIIVGGFVLELFEITPDYDLNLMKPNQNLWNLSSEILLETKKVFERWLKNSKYNFDADFTP